MYSTVRKSLGGSNGGVRSQRRCLVVLEPLQNNWVGLQLVDRWTRMRKGSRLKNAKASVLNGAAWAG